MENTETKITNLTLSQYFSCIRYLARKNKPFKSSYFYDRGISATYIEEVLINLMNKALITKEDCDAYLKDFEANIIKAGYENSFNNITVAGKYIFEAFFATEDNSTMDYILFDAIMSEVTYQKRKSVDFLSELKSSNAFEEAPDLNIENFLSLRNLNSYKKTVDKEKLLEFIELISETTEEELTKTVVGKMKNILDISE